METVTDEQQAEVQKHPQINDLSRQITKMMDERKAESSHTRLFKYGTEKLLHKSHYQSQNEKTTSAGTPQDLKNQIKRRGKPT